MKPTVGVIGTTGEPHAATIAAHLATLDVRPLFVDTQSTEVSLTLENGTARYGVDPLDEVPVFYLRSVAPPLPATPEAWQEAPAVSREWLGLWHAWLGDAHRRGQSLINPLVVNDMHHQKPLQLQLLREAGVPVPATLVTSDPDALRAFAARVSRVICKPVAGGALARLLDERDLTPESLAVLRRAPVIFQEYIPGRDLRVYTLDDEVVAAAIIHTTEVDYRIAEGPVELVDPGPRCAEIAVRAAAAAGCRFAGTDIKWTDDGRFVVLECNPSPMFLGFDQKARAGVAARLAAFLADLAHGRR